MDFEIQQYKVYWIEKDSNNKKTSTYTIIFISNITIGQLHKTGSII